MKTNYKSLDNNIWLSDDEKQLALKYINDFNTKFKPDKALDCLFSNMFGMDMLVIIYNKPERTTRKYNTGFNKKSIYYADAYVYNLDHPELSEAGLVQVVKTSDRWYRIA